MRSFVVLGVLVLAAAGCGSDSYGLVRLGGTAGAGGSAGMGGSAGVGGSAGMGGSAGVGGSTGMGGQGGSAGMAAAGVCDNGGDTAAIANAGDSLQSIGGTCGASTCLPQIGDPDAYASCVSTCIQTNVSGLSASCADCYGDVGGCGLAARCFACATDACSAGCLDCLNGAACLTTLETCTGIPVDACP